MPAASGLKGMHMNASPRTRHWRVTLSDGSAVEVHGRKVVVTDAGALMVVSEDGQPSQIWNAWAACTELYAKDRGATR